MIGRAVRLEIDLAAVVSNARAVTAALAPGARLFACLKGDAYGCGIRLVAPALAGLGVHSFAVGALSDAIALRAAGIDGEILLYPNCLPDSHEVIAAHGLTITLSSEAEALAWDAVAAPGTPAFLKIDTGALRAGVLPAAARALGDVLRGLRRVRIAGAYAHLHLPRPTGMQGSARWQFERFGEAVDALRADGLVLPTRMVSGTAAFLEYPDMDLDAVDPGRVLFGLGFDATRRSLALKPALSRWSARLLLAKTVSPADANPFGGPFPLAGTTRIGLIPVGWGDGLPRAVPQDMRVMVRGRRVPVLPPSHFEHLRVDLTSVPEADFGDEVVLLGRQGDATIGLDELATWFGRDPLHLLGTLPRHLERVAAPGP
jgi:alanine racemase